jgi:DNA-binding NarL/FixJ family response regulator
VIETQRSRIDADAVLDVVQRVGQSATEGEVLDLLFAAKDALGVEQAVFASFVRDDQSTESFRFLVAADATWCLAYQRQWWYSNDAWLMYAAANTEPAADSKIPLRTQHQKSARELAAAFGVESAYIVPAPAAAGISRIGVLMLGSSTKSYFDVEVGAIKSLSRSLAMELHEWWVRKIRDELLVTYRIGPEDLELLRLERAGESTKDIARRGNMTTAAVDSRFQRLNAKLGTPNRKATARLAAEYGLI